MQRQAHKPDKTPKKQVFNGGKQKNKDRKPLPTQPRVIHNNRTKRNRRNRGKKATANRNKMRRNSRNQKRNLQSTVKASHQNATTWEHARPRAYQIANQNWERNGYFRSPKPTYDRFGGLREKQKKFQRFARVDLPEDCTITDITSGWKTETDGSRV